MPVGAFVLSETERRTLEGIATRDGAGDVKRGHLEKLARLDLIEPCPDGICLSYKGKTLLSGNN